MYESNSPVTDHQGNPRNNQGLRNRSLLFRITGKRRTYTISDLYAREIFDPISLPGFVDEFDEPEIEDTEDSDTSSDSSSGDNGGNNGDDDMQDPADTGGDDDDMLAAPIASTSEDSSDGEPRRRDSISSDNRIANNTGESTENLEPTVPIDWNGNQLEENNASLESSQPNGIVDTGVASRPRDHNDGSPNSGGNRTMVTPNRFTGRRAALISRVPTNTTPDSTNTVELMEDEEIFETIPDSTKQEWMEMQEQQRIEDRKEKLLAEKRLAEIMRLTEVRRMTRQSSGTQDVRLCQLCVIAGEEKDGDYINGKHHREDCSLNHPMCAQCIHGLWRMPSAYAVGDTAVSGRRIKFSRGTVNCPLCSLDAVYVHRLTGKPIEYEGKSTIHGVIEWKNPFDYDDRLYSYIAGQGMDEVWEGMIGLFSSNWNLRPRAQKLVETELRIMFGDRTFNCNVCGGDKPMMERFQHTNGILNTVEVREGEFKEFRCTFEVCKDCLAGGKIMYQKSNSRILFQCPSCVTAKHNSRPHFQAAETWFNVRFLSTKSDSDTRDHDAC